MKRAFILSGLILSLTVSYNSRIDNNSETRWSFIAIAQAQELTTFPVTSPESQGLSTESLEKLADRIREYFEDELIVGAELLVIKNRYTVFHEGFGWMDREDKKPMECNTIFNVRSMTKTLTGAAAQILIDEGMLELKDPVAKYLPGFDNEKSKDITIEQLLTHRSGLPLSILKSTEDYEDLYSMANAIGELGPEFEPGSKFWYSDAGSEALGAVVEQVTGVTIDQYITENLLEPLGMDDSFYPIDKEDSRWARIVSLYGGTRGSWIKFWNPADGKPFYPFAWGSQTLYSTPMDYARFLAMWIDEGRAGGQQVLSSEAIARILTPVSVMTSLGSDMRAPTGFPGAEVYYGQMSVLYMFGDVDTVAPVVIGHSGSDATHAWVWPELDLMVFYFTQSRGSLSGIRLETLIAQLLINPSKELEEVEIPEEYQPFLGTYVANYGQFHNEEFVVIYQNGHLALDIPSQLVFELKDPDEEERWHFTLTDGIAVSFDRDETRNITGMRIYDSGYEFLLPKGVAPAEKELVIDAVQKYFGFYHDEEAGHDIEVKIHNNNLAVEVPAGMIFELYSPDNEGRWVVRISPNIWLRFNESDDGQVESMTRCIDGDEYIMPRISDK